MGCRNLIEILLYLYNDVQKLREALKFLLSFHIFAQTIEEDINKIFQD